jgi:chaperonin cofactor prefoldin
MTEAAANIPTMPDRSQRVREALLRFEQVSDRPSTLLKLDQVTLFEVGLLLSDPKLSIAEAWRESNAVLGVAPDAEPIIARSSFYRFADRFKALLGQVTAEHAQRRARLSVASATDDNVRNMTRLSRHRFVELLAEKLVSTDDLGEIEKYMSKMSALLADAERAQLAGEKLELDRLNYERLVQETRSKLEVAEQRIEQMQADAERKRSRIDERLSQLQSHIELLAKRAARGEIITEDQLRHADADLEAVRREAA